MKKYFLLPIYSFLITTLFSCTNIEPLTIGSIENVQVQTFSREGLEADLGIRIKNPNNISVIVFPSEFDATINGMDAGRVKLDKKVRINAHSDDVSSFHIKTDFSKLNLVSLIALLASKKADITLKGNIKAGKWYYKKSFPVEFRKTISLNQ